MAGAGFWASYNQFYSQLNFTTELMQKNEEIARLQRESAALITGGDSFCYMVLQIPDPTTGAVASPLFVHRGKYPLYDVRVRILDLDEYHRKIGHGPMTQGDLDTNIPLGNVIPGTAQQQGISLQHPSGRNFSYNVFYVARNGAWTQNLRMRWVGDGWATANRVIDGMIEAGKGPKELLREINPNYPRGPNGDVDWDERPPQDTPPQ